MECSNKDTKNIREAECIFIEMVDSDASEQDDAAEPNNWNSDTTDKGRYRDTNVIMGADIRSRVKVALDIDTKKHIRIVAKPDRRKLFAKRRKSRPKLEDLTTKCDSSFYSKTLEMKSDMYCWIVALSGVFYVLPAFQLMLRAQQASQSGNQDLCYYNFLCRRTSYYFSDYGHVFSNVVYIFCGIYLIVLVKDRSYRRRNAMIELYCENRKNANKHKKNLTIEEVKQKYSGRNVEFLNRCGIPEQYGVFYAMGGAMIIEGILSACYHVCPVDESFQFDTTFMYVMTVLLLLKMFQLRHPDITADAYLVFAIIAVMLIFQAIGYYSSKGVYMFFFLLTYFIFIVVVITDVYFQGDFRGGTRDIYQSIRGSKSLDRKRDVVREIVKPKNVKKITRGAKGRNRFFVAMGLMNLCLMIYVIYHNLIVEADNSEVANYLLFIFGANMVGYAVYYSIMKYYYIRKTKLPSEAISWTCWTYIILTICCAITGAYFFTSKEKKTSLSPARSRHINGECMFLFFDKHDIWHFTSAFGLLFAFMALLTLEDNNTGTSWEKIPVF